MIKSNQKECQTRTTRNFWKTKENNKNSSKEKQKAVATVFYIFTELSKAKTLIIRQLDQADDIIKASVGNEPGHEGYVIGGLKLVDRFRFSKMNFQQNNPLP